MPQIARRWSVGRGRARFSPFMSLVLGLSPSIPLFREQKISFKHFQADLVVGRPASPVVLLVSNLFNSKIRPLNISIIATLG